MYPAVSIPLPRRSIGLIGAVHLSIVIGRKPVYPNCCLVEDKDYFVLTTNVDHQFQKAGFDKRGYSTPRGITACWQCPGPAAEHL